MGFLGRGDIFGALDLGTTNCRLLIAQPLRNGMRVVDSFSRIVRLGEGLDASGTLSEPAMRRAIDALGVCAHKLADRQVTRARLVATEACRRAVNGAEFLARVQADTGLDLEVVPIHEEARLALAGCAPLLDPGKQDAVVFDIGGGSTEIMWVRVGPGHNRHGGGRANPATHIRGVMSLPQGVVSLTERYRGQPPGIESFQAMVAEMSAVFREFDKEWGISAQVAAGATQMLGSSGTVTTLAGIRQGLARYERARVDGTWLDFADIERISGGIVRMTPPERDATPCIGPGRADLMVAGCAILAAICETWPVGKLRVADRGVREGILAGLLAASSRGFRPRRPYAGSGGLTAVAGPSAGRG